MKIAIVARNELTIPPKNYGGSERVIDCLISELVSRHHEVVLFAKEGSKTLATKTIYYPKNLKDEGILDFVLENLPKNIDIIHDHSEMIIYDKEFNRNTKIKVPVLFTVHYPSKVYHYKNAIYPTKFIRDKIDGLKYREDNVIYHGLDFNNTDYPYEKDIIKNDLLYLGVIKPSKKIESILKVYDLLFPQYNLTIAGPKDPDNKDYIKIINNYRRREGFCYLGSVGGSEKSYLLSNSKAMIFPSEKETFGLAPIEAMACGVPCFFLKGCTGEELLEGINFPINLVCDNEEEIAENIKQLDNIKNADRIIMSNQIKNKFSSSKMCERYLEEYEKLLPKNRISLCMIVKNEEKTIGNCLESVHDIVDEIIIVDTGSTDKTKEICSKYTNKIYDFEWVYDFSAARNYSLKFATGNYIMFLDADDILKEESRIELKKVKDKLDGSVDLYWFYYDYRHDENGNSTYSFQTERLFKNNKGVKWSCIVHEVLDTSNLIVQEKTNVRITHTSNHDNTDKYLDFFRINMEERGYVFNSREKYFYSMELYKHNEYDMCYKLLNEIIQDTTGINDYEKSSVYNMLGCINRSKYNYKLAIEQLLLSTAIHQPLPSVNYEIAECYRALGLFNHAIYYYNTIIKGLLFKENFANESVYSNFDNEVKKYSIDSYLSLIMIYYNDLNDINLSEEMNNKLLELDPNNESALFNKEFFNSIKGGIFK